MATNKANNIEQFVTKYFDVIRKLCPYWPRVDNQKCEIEVQRCLLMQLTEQGELKDHITQQGDCKPKSSDKAFRRAVTVAFNYGQKVSASERLRARACVRDEFLCRRWPTTRC